MYMKDGVLWWRRMRGPRSASRLADVLPRDVEDADAKVAFERLEGTPGEVDVATAGARRASVSDDDLDLLAVLLVGDLDFLATGRADFVDVAVQMEVHGTDQGTVGVLLAAGTSGVVLGVPSTVSSVGATSGADLGGSRSLGSGLGGGSLLGSGSSLLGGGGIEGDGVNLVVAIIAFVVITIIGLGTGRSSLGGVALGGTGGESLAMSEGTAAGVEELGVVLVLAVESIVASVVDIIRLELGLVPGLGDGSSGNGGSEREDSDGCDEDLGESH